jgi:hypothetical protein
MSNPFMGFTILALTEFTTWGGGQLALLTELDASQGAYGASYRDSERQSITLQMEQARAAKVAKEAR